MSASLEADSTVVFTPHYSCRMNRTIAMARRKRSMKFQDRVEEEFFGKLNFFLAGELMIGGSSLRYMEEIRYPGTGWVLVEFSTSVSWLETFIQLRRLISRGYKPLIAHPERYGWCRRKRSRLVTLSRMGCGAMISARSFRIKKYALTARSMLKDGLSHAICSDAHSPEDQILDRRLKEKIAEFSRVPWEVLTKEIPEMILNDERLPELPLPKERKEE
ncbi:MAG: hypothetical protein KAH31_02245 [Candidatus Sabulitectum sp.]|nr:hypothetical protein [Candidatus Sabulitectum sp.]